MNNDITFIDSLITNLLVRHRKTFCPSFATQYNFSVSETSDNLVRFSNGAIHQI